jgi:hypothetical protein
MDESQGLAIAIIVVLAILLYFIDNNNDKTKSYE